MYSFYPFNLNQIAKYNQIFNLKYFFAKFQLFLQLVFDNIIKLFLDLELVDL